MSKPFRGPLGRKYFYSQKQYQQQCDIDEYNWAINVKPGDLVNCCDCWNRVVERVEHTWGTIGPDKDRKLGIGIIEWVSETEAPKYRNRIWIEATFYFTDGYQHSTSGGCACPVWTAKEVSEYHPGCDERGCKPQSNGV